MTSIVLTGANVVDPRDGTIAMNMDVFVTDGVISRVETTPSAVAGSTRRVDVAGKFLVPGYNDMHAHALNEKDPAGALELMLAYASPASGR